MYSLRTVRSEDELMSPRSRAFVSRAFAAQSIEIDPELGQALSSPRERTLARQPSSGWSTKDSTTNHACTNHIQPTYLISRG